MKEQIERKNISMYPSQWALVHAKSLEIGNSGNFSAGLRALVSEYTRLLESRGAANAKSPASPNSE